MIKLNLLIALALTLTIASVSGQTKNIGDQVWSTVNLDVSTFRNGEAIPQAQTAEEWKIARDKKQPAWCYYGNDPANGARYGKLYNWYAVVDPRGLAPKGWHIPTNDEWSKLDAFLGRKVKSVALDMKSSEGWDNNGNGTNGSGFSAFPGGARNQEGTFGGMGTVGFWWSPSSLMADIAWIWYVHSTNSSLGMNTVNASYGLSVRCVKD